MHRALQTQEIILRTFCHCFPTESDGIHKRHSTADLAALARTCRIFKEPALDVLWSELIDLSPLPRCVPDACQVINRPPGRRIYSFKRQLNEAEWTVLRSYTRRIWDILHYPNHHASFGNDSLVMICNGSVADPLFPNLRSFSWEAGTMIPAVHIAVPSLTTLGLHLTDGHVPKLKEFLDTVGDLCPNIEEFFISIPRPHDFDETICGYIRRLKNLQKLCSDGISLDADMILGLSEKSTLKHLLITLEPDTLDWVPSFPSPPIFPTLIFLEISCELLEPYDSLEPIIGLLSCIRIPALEHLGANITGYPSEEAFRSYIMTVRNICSSDSLLGFKFCGGECFPIPDSQSVDPDYQLTLDNVRPCTTFVNLRALDINLASWSVELTDNDMLVLVSAWPHLQYLGINDQWGWRTAGGITLRGLSQLLQARQSLSYLCVAIDTESYTDLPPSFKTESHPAPTSLTINLADSRIPKPEDVPALVEAFGKLGLQTCSFLAWEGAEMGNDVLDTFAQNEEWSRVFDEMTQAPEAVEEQKLTGNAKSG